MPDDRRFDRVACLALFGLNALVAWPLFHTEYLGTLESVEGIFITFAGFLVQHWPHVSWFPWFDAGMPLENTYPPLVPLLTAAAAFAARCSPALALHFVAALAYALGPVFLYLFARAVSERRGISLIAAVAWSLLSPSDLVPRLLADMGTVGGSRRLLNVVVYGETPHHVAVALLPLTLLAVWRSLDTRSPRRFAAATFAVAAVMASNTFGMLVVSISSMMLAACGGERLFRRLIHAAAILASAYLLICRSLPPSLARAIGESSQTISGDYRFTWKVRLMGLVFGAALVAVWAVTRRLADPMARFAALFAGCFAGIPALYYWQGVSFLPQPGRYQLEMDLSLCLLFCFAVCPLLYGTAQRYRKASIGTGALLLLWLTALNCAFARRLIRPLDITQTSAFREAGWARARLAGQRIMVSGENEFWFDLFTENPQLSAGHEPSAPNQIQRIAVYTIYTGQNAGERDAEISVDWMKAFGVAAITVPGPGSADHYHPFVNPRKFEGVLPLLWREGDDSIYQVPLRSASLAHVVPEAAVVKRRPVNGLDVEPLRDYLAALDDTSLPQASLEWETPSRGRIHTSIAPGQVVSLQINYDPGWKARSDGRPLRVRADMLGLTVIEPERAGEQTIDLEFGGGVERSVCLVISVVSGLGLLLMLALPEVRSMAGLKSRAG